VFDGESGGLLNGTPNTFKQQSSGLKYGFDISCTTTDKRVYPKKQKSYQIR